MTFCGFYELKNSSRVSGEIKFPFCTTVREGDRETHGKEVLCCTLKIKIQLDYYANDVLCQLSQGSQPLDTKHGHGELVPSAFNQTRIWKWFAWLFASWFAF